MPLGYAIVSTSSEDSVYNSDNLFNPDIYRPWLTDSIQEKAVIELEFETDAYIKNIEVGNASTALFEVLVGKESAKKLEDYRVILPITSLMSIKDVKANANKSRIRYFGAEKLNKRIAEEKWKKS